MDILRFINSKDIRKHLRDTCYEFSPLEAAWIIYHCRDATIKEKHMAWKELIEIMPDCRIEKRRWNSPQESLHDYLRKYMDAENRLVSEFYNPHDEDASDKTGMYVYKLAYKPDGCWFGDPYYDMVFSSMKTLKETYLSDPVDEAVNLICTRLKIDDGIGLDAYFTPEFGLLDIAGDGVPDEEKEVLHAVFPGLWFDFPVPFVKGDILWDPKCPHGSCDRPFVTTGVCLDGIESDSVKDNIRKNGDTTDMCAGGYFLNEDGSVYSECVSNYMDLELYEKELTGSQRTLIALSNFIKGEIDPGLFVKAYHQIITDGYAESSIPHDVSESDLVLSGIKKPEHIKIWMDDLRDAPEGYYRCFSVNEAKEKIKKCEFSGDIIDVIDCDHDMGYKAADGGDGIKLIEWLADRETHYPVKLHTMNPVGRDNMQRIIDRYWEDR